MPDLDQKTKIRLKNNFYAVQKRQWQKSLFLFLVLLFFYFLSISLVSFAVLFGIGFVFFSDRLHSADFWEKFLVINSLVAFGIALVQFIEARLVGASFILKRLGAKPPDPSDRYHKRFENIVEEIRLACGLPKITPHVISQAAVNSLAMIAPDKTPHVVVTEGMLSDFSRDELTAAVSHEIAHILRGDAFYVTLVCSLSNFFEKIREALTPAETQPHKKSEAGAGALQVFVYLAVSMSSLIMRLLSVLVSREREILADAAAVEICRNPKALAGAVYKAHVKNSFVGDFNLTYGPLYIVNPKAKDENEGFWSRLFSSHPPLSKRMDLLGSMANTDPKRIVEDLWKAQKQREQSRTLLLSKEELVSSGPVDRIFDLQTSLPPNPVWVFCGANPTVKDPLSLEDLMMSPMFTPGMWVRNLQEGIEAPAREFPQIKEALGRWGKKKPLDPHKHNKCPRCRYGLVGDNYEGVTILHCRQCDGKLVSGNAMVRILTRREVTFSEHLMMKAKAFRDEFLYNPMRKFQEKNKKNKFIICPNCGSRMLERPYSYQYFVPVDKCMSCHMIWFDTDELEILQILVEDIA